MFLRLTLPLVLASLAGFPIDTWGQSIPHIRPEFLVEPNYAERRLSAIQSCLDRGDFEGAESVFGVILPLDDRLAAEAFLRIAEARLAHNHVDAAREKLDFLVETRKGRGLDPAGWLRIARLRVALGDREGALAAGEQAFFAEQPRIWGEGDRAGKDYMNAGDWGMAMRSNAAWQARSSCIPGSAESERQKRNLLCLAHLGKFDLAVECAWRVSIREDRFSDAEFFLFRLYAEAEQLPQLKRHSAIVANALAAADAKVSSLLGKEFRRVDPNRVARAMEVAELRNVQDIAAIAFAPDDYRSKVTSLERRVAEWTLMRRPESVPFLQRICEESERLDRAAGPWRVLATIDSPAARAAVTDLAVRSETQRLLTISRIVQKFAPAPERLHQQIAESMPGQPVSPFLIESFDRRPDHFLYAWRPPKRGSLPTLLPPSVIAKLE